MAYEQNAPSCDPLNRTVSKDVLFELNENRASNFKKTIFILRARVVLREL